MARPLETLEDGEIFAFWKRNRALRHAWEAIGPYLRARDPRGAKRLVFIAGWLACERAHRERLRKIEEEMEGAMKKAVDRAVRDYEQRTGLYLLD